MHRLRDSIRGVWIVMAVLVLGIMGCCHFRRRERLLDSFVNTNEGVGDSLLVHLALCLIIAICKFRHIRISSSGWLKLLEYPKAKPKVVG